MSRSALALALALAACTSPPPRLSAVDPQIAGVIAKTAERKPESRPEAIQSAVLPPLRLEMPATEGLALEPRFDLSVSNAPASQVFMSIVSGTRYNMLVHPSVTGTVSVTLKDVTVPEALAAIRDLYGFDYRIEANRIFIQPTGLQTRVFQVNYLPGQRRGSTVLRVTSGSLTDAQSGGFVAPVAGVGTPGAAGTGTPGGLQGRESSRVSTDQQATFWVDLCAALVAIVFPADGAPPAPVTSTAQPEDSQRSVCNRRHVTSDRSIVVTPHSGVIVVRGTSMELRAVENYLRATRLAVERQVMLEAKIIEVTLSDAYLAGINWAILGKHLTAGQLAAGEGNAATLGAQGALAVVNNGANALVANPAARSIATATNSFAGANPAGGVFGFALQTSNFAALLAFLESQGAVQVLSSPRIATLNNQKAVLKVGFDELFVSNLAVSPPQISGGTTTQATIAPQFSPYFQGIVLDVTPQIDENGMITLHVHPSISEITPVNRSIDLGTGGGGTTTIPTARSQVSETDTIVRVGDSNIVAIGGLMSVDVRDNRGGIPGVSDDGLGMLLRNTDRRLVKRELVILLKPTIIQSDRNWDDDLRETRERFNSMGTPAQETRRGTPPR
ncbi:MAG TPA: secretin N-terminal domain-containing protein [Burkholderiales bacterium]|nr:secretin N-terminal domain-containing protein [Burkholderiales bacterium]